MHPVQLDHLRKFDNLNSFNEPRKILPFFCCQINSLRWFDVFGQSNRLSQLDNLNYWNQSSFIVQSKTCSLFDHLSYLK